MNILLLSLVGICGVALIVTAANRRRSVLRMRDWLLKSAELLWEQAEKRSKDNDPRVIESYNSLIELAALCPSIGYGVVKLLNNPDTNEKGDRVYSLDTLNDEPWMVQYIAVAPLAVTRLMCIANPLDFKLVFSKLHALSLLVHAITRHSKIAPGIQYASTEDVARDLEYARLDRLKTA